MPLRPARALLPLLLSAGLAALPAFGQSDLGQSDLSQSDLSQSGPVQPAPGPSEPGAPAQGLPSAGAQAAGPSAPAASVAPEQTVAPEQMVAALSQALKLPDLFDIMREEGKLYGADLEDQLFPGRGGAEWQAEVAGIYDPERIAPIFRAAFARALGQADAAPMRAFFEGPLGQRATELEIAARRALLDPGAEEAAALAREDMLAENAPRLKAIRDFIAAGDLVEANVSGGLNASLAFSRGLAEGGALPYGTDEEEMLSDVWAQEGAIRAETEGWLLSYLALAYDPLSDAELAEYTRFSASPAGRQLNRALFAGFDAVFEDVSYRLGTSAAYFVAGHEI